MHSHVAFTLFQCLSCILFFFCLHSRSIIFPSPYPCFPASRVCSVSLYVLLVFQTSVCRSMISWPTRGMVALAFSHSTACISSGEACRGSSSLRTHDGGEWVFLMPSHTRLLGVCCLSYIIKHKNVFNLKFM